MAIKLLDKNVINKISAGEVVEKPASIVKELVENSIDAGATSISIEIEGGGIDKIVVTDNGCGIKSEEVILAFMPHATSKITQFDDLDNLATMGFRGEALATISAVSKVTITTKTELEDTGIKCEIVSGEEVGRQTVACVTGTKIEVKDVFYNTPARLKFLRKPKSEEGDITGYVQKLILSHSDINFKYIVDGKIIYNTIGGGVLDNIYSIYGKEFASNMIEVNYEIADYKVFGYISKPEFGKANRTYQNLFVNSRFCNNALVSTAVASAYENFTMKGKFPAYVLFISLPQNELDVNVHPNKLEVKFTNTSKIFKLCQDGVFMALSDFNHIRPVDMNQQEEKVNVIHINEVKEGVSYSSLSIDGESLETKTESTEKPSTDEIKKMFRDYFKNNKNDGSYGFRSTDNLVAPTQSENKNDFVIEEVVLTAEVENKPEIKQEEIKVQTEQESYNNLFEQDYSYVGKIFNTYLILEQNDKVFLIDQHAAHERIKYDKLMEELNSNGLKKQDLMFPYTFTVTANEYTYLLDNLNVLNSFGIEICEFGNFTFKISSVPMLLAEINLKNFVGEMLANINGIVKSPKDIIKEKFMQMACKSAVKGGDDLKDIEIKELLNKLNQTKVLLCPHGRPIVTVLEQKQIEKWFKRIV